MFLWKLLHPEMTENVQTTLITTIESLLTIVGSIFIVYLTLKANLKEKKVSDVRTIKLKYYHQFCKAYVNKFIYGNLNNCPEQVEANTEFIREINRIPLYASYVSQEMVELLFDDSNNPTKAPNVNFSKMYSLIRKDLNSDEFKIFDEIFEETFKASVYVNDKTNDKTVVKDENGNRLVVDNNKYK